MENQHLIQQAQDALLLTDEERIAFMLNEKWFLYPIAKEILKELEFHLKHPKKNRMKGRLIVGGTNNGKTSIINKFIRSHMPYDDENVKITPVVAVSAPESSNPSDLYGSILHKLGVPYKNTDRATKKKEKVEGIFLLCRTNMLIIDEIHNIIVAPVQKQKAFMVALKNLSNELMIPIILVGTADALHAINTDSQISNRFPPLVVPKWKYDRAFLSLLASIEKTLPLRKQSNMATSKEISNYILDYSEGYIGEIIDLVNLAAQYAIEQKIESITMETLKKSNFVRPSMRKNITDFIEI
ncbi:TniB family NTP-binding protein [Campylobacter concisus]